MGAQMRYEDSIGFSFELPEGWRHTKHTYPVTFYRLREGDVLVEDGVLELGIGGILPQYAEVEFREAFLRDPGVEVYRTQIGDEQNALIVRSSEKTEISVVRDGIQYLFSYQNAYEPAMQALVESIKQSAQFPFSHQADVAVRQMVSPDELDPISSAIVRGSAEDLQVAINSAPKVRGKSGVIFVVPPQSRVSPRIHEDETSARDEDGSSAHATTPDEVKFLNDAAEGRTAQVLAHIRNGVNLDFRNPSGVTALMIAAERGHGAVVSELLKAGANPNIAFHNAAYRALHTAAQEGHVSIMRDLVDHGAEVDAATIYGETALISAAFSGQRAACHLLLERGADPAARDANGNTAAKWAAKKGRYALAYVLWHARKVAVVPRSTPTRSPGGDGGTDATAASTDHDAADLSALLRRVDSLNNQLIRLAQMGTLGANRGLISELTAAI